MGIAQRTRPRFDEGAYTVWTKRRPHLRPKGDFMRWNESSRDHSSAPVLCCAVALAAFGIVAVRAQAQMTETVLHNFPGSPPMGASPESGVVRDNAGNFYGTTVSGGAANAGVVYKVDPAGTETVLYSFTGGADGGIPSSGVILDPAGNLYGTAEGGGAGYGVVYEVAGRGHETVLYTFKNEGDGAGPQGVVRDGSGNLYGTTIGGGTGRGPGCLPATCGVVYKLDPAGNETVLYRFTGGADGGLSYAGVILDAEGNLYGNTEYGGAPGCGVVFKVDRFGHETVLYSFTGGADGGNPQFALVRDESGNLYGTTQFGGTANWGTVFKIDTAGTKTTLFSFGGAAGAEPSGTLTLDSGGDLYGVCSLSNTVFKLDPAGQETVLYTFQNGVSGDYPNGDLLRDASGNLYGTTLYGGPASIGVIYGLDPSGHLTVIHGFKESVEGTNPAGAVVRDSAGTMYGVTTNGGPTGLGIVYSLDTAGREAVLYSFTGVADGARPKYGLARDPAGNLYGTASAGRPSPNCTGNYANECGVVFKVDPAGHETVLHAFTGGADGGIPSSGVVLDKAGNLYGTTSTGGLISSTCSSGCGVVYKLDPAGNETVLYTFQGGSGGPSVPTSGVVMDAAGNLYGVANGGLTDCFSTGCGVVYKLDSAGNETNLYEFQNTSNGYEPSGTLALDSAGNVYGTAALGGGAGAGVVYKVDAAGEETVLYRFRGASHAPSPSGLIRDAAGNLYGTSISGGPSAWGFVYKVDASGNGTVLYSFDDGSDGGTPGGLTLGNAGDIIGTTANGGEMSGGVVFVLQQ